MNNTRGIVVAVLVVASGLLTRAGASDVRVHDVELSTIPYAFGAWRGEEAPQFDRETRQILAADTVLTRVYKKTGAALPIGLYVAYYARQRPGVSIHSPLHCLPGTGWEPIEVTRRSLSTSDSAGPTIRQMIVRKQRQRAVVLYWYAIHGRTIAGEVTSKATLLGDSLFLRGSDAALVRIVAPLDDTRDDVEQEAAEFARALIPYTTRIGANGS